MKEEKPSDQFDPRGKIWLTSKTRILSHGRFAFYDLLSYIVLTAYSIILLTFSVFEDHLSNTSAGIYTSEISIVLSVSILSASLVIWGLKLGKTADEHRRCYLELQRLYDDQQNYKTWSDYNEILDRYPNHSNYDYEKMLFINICLHRKPLKNQEGLIQFRWWQVMLFLIKSTIRFIFILIAILLPSLIFWFIYVAI